MRIITFSADGKRLRNHSLAAVTALVATGRMCLGYAKTGKRRVVHATYLPRSGTVLKTAHMGQTYSVLEKLTSGHQAWKHKELPSRPDAQQFVRQVFFAVPLSCMTPTRRKPQK